MSTESDDSREAGEDSGPAGPIFRMGTWIGKTYDEIQASGEFGERISPRVRRGSWNVPHRLDFSGRLGSDDPYNTHIGFFENREAAYILYEKRALTQGNTINEVEAANLLYKVASGGDWSGGIEGTHRSIWRDPDADEAADFAGTFFEYTHRNLGDTFRLFAYLLHNKRQLLIWPPTVTPNLGGTARAPGARIESVSAAGADAGDGNEDEDLLEDHAGESGPGESISGDPFGED